MRFQFSMYTRRRQTSLGAHAVPLTVPVFLSLMSCPVLSCPRSFHRAVVSTEGTDEARQGGSRLPVFVFFFNPLFKSSQENPFTWGRGPCRCWLLSWRGSSQTCRTSSCPVLGWDMLVLHAAVKHDDWGATGRYQPIILVASVSSSPRFSQHTPVT